MGMGVNAVKAEIMSEFNVRQLAEHYDVDSASIHIGFRADGRHFLVSVSEEFDQDFGSFPQIDLSRLADILRASKDGKATVTRSAIYSGISN